MPDSRTHIILIHPYFWKVQEIVPESNALSGRIGFVPFSFTNNYKFIKALEVTLRMTQQILEMLFWYGIFYFPDSVYP